MQRQLIEQSPAIVASVRRAFHNSQPCHCTGPGKLSEDELLRALVAGGAVRLTDAMTPDLMPIAAFGRAFPWSAYFRLEQRGIKHLGQLCDLAYADLVALPDIGPVAATAIERLLARHGLALKDGDLAAVMREDDEPASPPAASDAPPAEVRRACVVNLGEMGRKLLADGSALVGHAVKVAAGAAVGPTLGRYLHCEATGHREVARIVAPLRALDERAKAARKARKRVARGNGHQRPSDHLVIDWGKVCGRPAEQPVADYTNVVEGSFGKAAAGD